MSLTHSLSGDMGGNSGLWRFWIFFSSGARGQDSRKQGKQKCLEEEICLEFLEMKEMPSGLEIELGDC